jgi:hypothetical protein
MRLEVIFLSLDGERIGQNPTSAKLDFQRGNPSKVER